MLGMDAKVVRLAESPLPAFASTEPSPRLLEWFEREVEVREPLDTTDAVSTPSMWACFASSFICFSSVLFLEPLIIVPLVGNEIL